MKTFFTSDLHLGDERQKLLGRPFRNADHCANEMLKNWNAVIKPEDEVYVVGDWCLNEEWLKGWTPKFNGKKYLVLGNYDSLEIDLYANYFHGIFDDNFLITCNAGGDMMTFNCQHYPSKASEKYFNLVGHIHGCWRVQKNMLNVGVDANHFRPLSADDVSFFYKAICDFYDQDVWVSEHIANKTWDSRGKAGTYVERGFRGTAS